MYKKWWIEKNKENRLFFDKIVVVFLKVY